MAKTWPIVRCFLRAVGLAFSSAALCAGTTLGAESLDRLAVPLRANSHGFWGTQEVQLAFQILPSAWDTWWLRVLALLGLGAVAGGQFWRIHHQKLRRREERALRDAHLLAQGTIDALTKSICVLDDKGWIIAVNDAWVRFARENGQNLGDRWRTMNYLQVCDRASGPGAEQAVAFAAGIRAIAAGSREQFEMEYSCHSPLEQRWFVGRVTRFMALDQLRIVVAHENITRQKAAALALRQAQEELEARVQQRTAELQSAHDLIATSRERLISMSLRLVEIQESERRAIARELHDEIGQLLTSLRILLDMTDRQGADTVRSTLGEAKAIAGELIDRIRQLSLDLRPPMLDDLGLLATLEWHFKRYTKLTGIRVQFTQTGLPHRFESAVETAAYRLVQEALTNVARYAGVSEVRVAVHHRSQSLDLIIEDRGAGFDPEVVLAADNSNGLSSMRERVSLLHGRFEVESRKGIGTRIIIHLPLTRGAANSIVPQGPRR